MRPIPIPIGAVYGRLTVVERLPLETGKRRMFKCDCSCGNRTQAQASHLHNGAIQSCGCWRSEMLIKRNTTHGDGKSGEVSLYKVWADMLQRCTNPNNKSYQRYGGRGITVCTAWLEYGNFKRWADKAGYQEGLTIDRKNNNGNYNPQNCRWVTRSAQSKNRNKSRGCKNKYIGVLETKCGTFAVDISVARKRLHLGTFPTPEQAAATRDAYILDNKLPFYKLNFGHNPL